MVGTPPKPPWSFVCLEQDGYKSKIAIQVTLLPWTQFSLFTDSGCLTPLPWPSFNHEAVIECISVGTLFCFFGWLQIEIQWEIAWPSSCSYAAGLLLKSLSVLWNISEE
jgi:hypothetical protein